MKSSPDLYKSCAVLVALAGFLAATVRLVTSFGAWDDEGYMLLSLSRYVQTGHLYTLTFSQYGPFYFYLQGVFFELLHLPVNHDMGRAVTLIYWIASALLAATFVYRVSKSVFLASAGGLCIALDGLVLTNEPGHPQQVVLLLYMASAYFSLPSSSARRWSLNLFLLGGIGAALVFTKVNVGIFYLAGLTQSLVCLLPSGWVRSVGIGLGLIYAAVFPFALMHGNFDRGFRGYCAVATVCGVGTLACGALLRSRNPLPWRAALWIGTGLMAGVLLIIVAALGQGISGASLLSGVILDPMHHPKVFDMPLYISGIKTIAIIGLAGSVVLLRSLGAHFVDSRWFNALRCAVGTAAVFSLTLPGIHNRASFDFVDPLGLLADSSVHRIEWVIAVLPLALLIRPHGRQSAHEQFFRVFVTFMAVTQFLEAYPVAGSQAGIAAAPMILCAFLVVSDGITGLRSAKLGAYQESGKLLASDALIGGSILFILAGLSIGLAMRSQFPPASGRLRGASWLRLPPAQTKQYEAIVTSVRRNCSVLFSMPGMGSFNIWSDVPAPNGWNLTAWMKGFSGSKQEEILTLLRSDSQACVIVNRTLERFWDRQEDDAAVAAMPLPRYILSEMPETERVGAYEIHVNPRRTLPWVRGR